MTNRAQTDWNGFSRADLARWGGSLLTVLAASAGATVGWMAQQEPFEAPGEAPAAIVIDMAPLPVAAPEHAITQPPGPEREQARPKPKPPRKILPQPAKQAELAREKTPPKPDPDKTPPAEHASAPPIAALPPDRTTAAPAEGASQSEPSDAVPSWQGKLLAHLERHKRYPAAAQQRRQQGVAYLYFVMDRAGKVLAYRLQRSSGYALLDTEALALLLRAQPLPPPPAEIGRDRIELNVPVEFFIR